MARNKIKFDGEEFDLLDDETLTWAEAAVIERTTGMTIAGNPDSIQIMGGYVWASIKRKRPTFKFSEFMALPMGDVEEVPDEETGEGSVSELVEDGDPLDGSEPPGSASETSEMSTPPSSTSSGASPGLTGTG